LSGDQRLREFEEQPSVGQQLRRKSENKTNVRINKKVKKVTKKVVIDTKNDRFFCSMVCPA
jgi:hypothetical protein